MFQIVAVLGNGGVFQQPGEVIVRKLYDFEGEEEELAPNGDFTLLNQLNERAMRGVEAVGGENELGERAGVLNIPLNRLVLHKRRGEVRRAKLPDFAPVRLGEARGARIQTIQVGGELWVLYPYIEIR